MDFTLKYRGLLKSAGSKRITKHKHCLRKHFHRQLAVLWRQNDLLRLYKPHELQCASKAGKWFNVKRPVEDRGLFWRHHIRAYNVIPLVNHIHLVHCHLAIRMHCPRDQGSILYGGGDIDNRLKVLLDSLTMPQEDSQIPSSVEAIEPDSSPPLFCLLESDELVTKLSVEMLPLLDERKRREYSMMDIDVHIEPVYPMEANLGMLFR